jgi:hydroxypyruvate reductase
MMEHIPALLRMSHEQLRPAYLISGGEFSCPVRGKGIGGRNLETALRCAIALDQRRAATSIADQQLQGESEPHVIVLSAGTDGIDGNSPAAGAIADETTVSRGSALGLEAEKFLTNSDAYSYFKALGDLIITGPTGTNVRDFRVLVAGG